MNRLTTNRKVEIVGVIALVEYTNKDGGLMTPSLDEVKSDLEAAGFAIEAVFPGPSGMDAPGIDGCYRVGFRTAA